LKETSEDGKVSQVDRASREKKGSYHRRDVCERTIDLKHNAMEEQEGRLYRKGRKGIERSVKQEDEKRRRVAGYYHLTPTRLPGAPCEVRSGELFHQQKQEKKRERIL